MIFGWASAKILSGTNGETYYRLNCLLTAVLPRKFRKDTRSRRDRVQRVVEQFAEVQEGMVSAYMEWQANRSAEGWEDTSVHGALGEETRHIRVVDVFRESDLTYSISADDPSIPAALIRHGAIPCSPLRPSVAVSIRTMEIFRLQRLRCPRLSIQSFVRFLCDIHLIPVRKYLYQQFSVCFDLYIAILDSVRQRVEATIGFDGPDWRIQHACPCCLYRLEGEDSLRFSMLLTYDGNDSAKRILRRARNADGSVGLVNEHLDQRIGGGTYFLPREEVEEWSKEKLQDLLEPVSIQERQT